MKLYKVRCTFTTDMLGTAPSDPNIYGTHIVEKLYKADRRLAGSPEERKQLADEKAARVQEEIKLLKSADRGDDDNAGPLTVIRQDDGGLILMEYMVKGFFKQAGSVVGHPTSSKYGIKTLIDTTVFVTDAAGNPVRTLPLMRDGAQVTEQDKNIPRSLRAETAQGPRVCIANSESVLPGVYFDFYVRLMPNFYAKGVSKTQLEEWLDYGKFIGFGQWRTGGYGRFDYTLEDVSVKDESDDREDAVNKRLDEKAADKEAKKEAKKKAKADKASE